MATQLVSQSGVVAAQFGYVATGALREVTQSTQTMLAQSFMVGATTRALSASGLVASQLSYTLGANDRSLSKAVSTLSAGSLISFLNLRVLSAPLTSYSAASLLRTSPMRPVSQGYEVLIPKPVVVEPPEDVTAPVVGNFVPGSGTAISKTTPIAFDVTDDSGQFRRIFVMAFFAATGACEVIHDGDAFRGFYAANSSRRLIAGGFRYTVARTGGWPAAPSIQTFAMDATGNEAN